MKKNKVIEGWVDGSIEFGWEFEPEEMVLTIYRKKGLKEHWLKDQWPPRKVRIIVEEP